MKESMRSLQSVIKEMAEALALINNMPKDLNDFGKGNHLLNKLKWRDYTEQAKAMIFNSGVKNASRTRTTKI
jgi:hypothetical protein